MENLNNVPSTGTFGNSVQKINSNFDLIVNAINSLEYQTTRSKGILNYGQNPATVFPNAVEGDWCMILSEGNVFPATIKTFNGSTWSGSGTWNPDGVDLTGYVKTTDMTTAIANSLAQATARMGYGECTVSGTALTVSIPNFILPTSGGTIHIKMSAAGTGASTLSINGTTAKTLWYNGAAVSAQNTWEAQEIISVFYDGTKYMASNSQGGNNVIKLESGSPDSDLDIADENDNILAKFQNGEIKTKRFDSANTPQQKNATADLEISDENDNVLVRFRNGHIRTKNFDSANIGYKNLEGKTFSILGDSISTFQGYIPSGYAYFYPAGNLTNVADTWWQKMAQETKLTLLKNCSWSGSDMCGDSTSTISAQAGCSTKRISDLADGGISPDIVIVYIGINDFYHAGNITLGTWTPKNEIPAEGTINHFSEAYALCLHKIMLAYPNSEIYCCSLLECKTADTDDRYPVINSNNEYLIDFNNKIKEIADGLGVYFIDVHSCGINYWNGQGDTLIDSTHPNVKGAGLVSRCITNAILSLTKKYQ